MHLLPPRTNFLARLIREHANKGSSLLSVLVGGALLLVVSLGIFRGVNQQNKIAISLRQKTKFLQVEQELKARIRTAMSKTLSQKGCQAKFRNWYQENRSLDSVYPFKLDFSRKAIVSLPNSIKTRCMQQYSNRPINNSLYFCAKLVNMRSSDAFIEQYDVFTEVKLYYWNHEDAKSQRCSWNAKKKSLNRSSLKYLYTIYWRKRVPVTSKNRIDLNFYRGWAVSQL